MKTMVKRLLMVVLVFSMVSGGVGVSIPKEASAKAKSKVTKVVTLKKKTSTIHELSIKNNEDVITKIKILSRNSRD